MHCRNCGKELIGTPEYCVGCGAKPMAGNKFCQACGAATDPMAELCLKCGAKLGKTTLVAGDVSPKSRLITTLLAFFSTFGSILEHSFISRARYMRVDFFCKTIGFFSFLIFLTPDVPLIFPPVPASFL